ncbi:hypothetical protein [Microvirga massiliensis]|uniref:hypothetical protein n=1 Tax=Microvirga massiliensis TaxID=1033741 RepID=UPI00062B923B|nr:hypothetical protein [Microvirga massiliensis]
MISIFHKARYVRTADGLELYQGPELVEMLSVRDKLGIFFEITVLPSGTRLVQIARHGDAQDVSPAFEAKRRIWKRAGWPVENLHLLCLNVAAITDEILDEINSALLVEDRAHDLSTRILELLMPPPRFELPLAA